MFNLSNGISSYHPEPSPETRRTANNTAASGPAGTVSGSLTPSAPGNTAQPVPQATQTNTATQTFIRDARSATPPQTQAQTPQPGNPLFSQAMPGFVQQVVAQVISFFKGNTRETRAQDDDRAEYQRQRNDDASPDMLGDSKVEQSGGAEMGGGET